MCLNELSDQWMLSFERYALIARNCPTVMGCFSDNDRVDSVENIRTKNDILKKGEEGGEGQSDVFEIVVVRF